MPNMDTVTLGEHDAEQRGYWDAKQTDDINLLLGSEDGLYHHHYGIGDYDHAVLDAPAGRREEQIQRELHRMETLETGLVLDALGEVPSTARVMDAGSGRGGTSFVIADKFGCRVDGVNYCAHHVDFTQNLARERGVANRVQFHFTNMMQTPFEDGTFDFIVSNETTMCVDIHKAFAEFSRLLRPGGRYVAVTWSRHDAVHPRSEASREIDEHYLCGMHKRSTYFEALAANGLVPYHVRDHTEEAIPYWELREHSELRTGVEAPFLRGFREQSIDYLVIASERV
ncbi:methyltransferase domain-containing protein [Streptomyces sp. WI04-05B]|uniref:Methyltransferase n=2 Tax=Streptomyces turgidiscabies TaxID=85558 RepID=L7F2C7_STRT8|nr:MULTISPECIES: methyltransferase domain-containing protein [Streptomyces]ELP65788.1 methyltransferase [Streptomyces turgidiscabies Car8]MDX2548210.1 methyltransferase domain-containing protein [Streptomyces sp. WI04-05B]MDX2590247.1 methyltransferase domain-containing protein [Streptomyces sp. WI04-05A]MDX3499999.1 methyltransferase domain-containing protein [Streptomyces turgidiscabies]GAQ77382.1 geranyl diphosphate 2-C-methyltransferase [Streptomyces turgidiscabies]